MPMIRRPQPPGDSGSRRKLVNRKGDVSSVEHAYPGIVNVYALVPIDPNKNEDPKPITLETFSHGMLTVATGSTRYTQGGARKGGDGGGSGMARGPVFYDWRFNGHLKREGLYPVGDAKGSDATAATKSPRVNRQIYEQILNMQPLLVKSYDLSKPEDAAAVRKAVTYVNKINTQVGSLDYERAILHQALQLHTTPNQMRLWAKENIPAAAIKQTKKQIDTDIRYLTQSDKTPLFITSYLQKNYQLSPEKSVELMSKYNKESISSVPELTEGEKHKPVEIVQKELPRSLDDTAGKLPSNKADFMPIQGDAIKTAKKGDIYYDVLPSGSVMYYIRTSSLSADRRRKLKSVKIKRVAYRIKRKISISNKKSSNKKPSNSIKTNKCSRSSKMKKHLLNKIKCRCGRKK